MKIIRNENEYILTSEEVREAYMEQKIKYQIQDAKTYLSDYLFGENTLEDHDVSQTLICKEKYGVEPENFFDEDSNDYILDQIVEDYNSRSDCNIAGNITYSDVIERIMRNLFEENPNKGLIPLSDDSFLPEIKLWSTEEYTCETDDFSGDNFLCMYIPITFDVCKAFDLTEADVDMFNMYISYFSDRKAMKMTVYYMGTTDEYTFDVALSDEQRAIIVRVLNEQSQTVYGSNLDELLQQEIEFLLADESVILASSERKVDPDGYSIYQLNSSDDMAYIRFMSYSYLINKGIRLDPSNYDCVYKVNCSVPDSNEGKINLLEEIYTKFNIDVPEDFEGYSLSVSDVIVLKNKNGLTSFYCDTIGFKEITEIWRC